MELHEGQVSRMLAARHFAGQRGWIGWPRWKSLVPRRRTRPGCRHRLRQRGDRAPRPNFPASRLPSSGSDCSPMIQRHDTVRTRSRALFAPGTEPLPAGYCRKWFGPGSLTWGMLVDPQRTQDRGGSTATEDDLVRKMSLWFAVFCCTIAAVVAGCDSAATDRPARTRVRPRQPAPL